MTTKAEELEILKQIEKLIAKAGADSYIATAFEGCAEDAAANIRDDAGNSYKSRYEYAEKQIEKAKEEAQRAWNVAEAAKMRAERAEKSAENAERMRESGVEIAVNLAAAERQIVELKAKLYDLITAN